MTRSCSMVNCTIRFTKGKFGMFDLPKVNKRHNVILRKKAEARRQKWLCAIKRKDLEKKSLLNIAVCSRHFISGKPARLKDDTDPDWVPRLFLGHSGELLYLKQKNVVNRHCRVKNRMLENVPDSSEPTMPPNPLCTSDILNCSGPTFSMSNTDKGTQVNLTIYKISASSQTDFQCKVSAADTEMYASSKKFCTEQNLCNWLNVERNCESCQVNINIEYSISVMTQTSSDMYYNYLEAEIKKKNKCISGLEKDIQDIKLTRESFEGNDKKVTYYTGLPCYFTLMFILDTIKPFLKSKRIKLDAFQQLLIFLMRMRLLLGLKDLAYRFKVSPSTVFRVFHHVLDVCYYRLHHTVHWPDRENIRKIMPLKFIQAFGNRVVSVVDCFEIRTYKPSNLKAQALIHSRYKRGPTAKFLLSETPQGVSSYVSKGYGGRCSDKYIISNSGYLRYLLPGDIILADRGFDIRDYAEIYCFQVKMPAFTRGKPQLSPIEVEESRIISNLRGDIERLIGLVRNKYRICRGPVPVSFLKKNASGLSTISKVVFVACALVNHCPGIINLN